MAERTHGDLFLCAVFTGHQCFSTSDSRPNPRRSEELTDPLKRVNAAFGAPFDKLGQIDPPVSGFAVVDPRLRLPQAVPQVALGQVGVLPELPKELDQTPM